MKRKLAMAVMAVLITPLAAQQKLPVYLNEGQSLELRVQDALSKMTLEEKVKLCTAQSKFSSHGVPRLGIPELWMSDGPHGVRMEILWDSWGHAKWNNDSCTAFPALTCLAATWNPGLAATYGNAIGEEARYRRKDVLLGPGVNIYRTPLNGRNFEYMGEDPYLASKMVVPYVKGVQHNGVAACVKHFALNNQEKWRGHIDVELSDRALYEIYLPAFRSAIVEGKCWSIMGAYNKLRGEHCCHNDLLLTKILKRDWGFDGCVITDWGGAHDTYQAAMNGLDIEMGSFTNGLTTESEFTYDDYYLAKPYLKMLQEGKVPMSTIEDKASRILRLIFRTAMNSKRPWGQLASPEHHTVARQIAEEGIVLLKNEKSLLPIDKRKYTHILVVGENAVRSLTVGGGSSELKVKNEVSPLQGFIDKFGADKIRYTLGYASGETSYERVNKPELNTDSLLAEAVKLASESDLVLYVGGLNKNTQQDCEGDDRNSFGLPFGQDELLRQLAKVNSNLVVVLLSGNAVEMPWVKDVPSILQGWFLGSEAGTALANVLSGDVNPSGKLPFTFPVKLEDCGAHAFGEIAYPGDNVKEVYKEDILVGYRWYDTKKIAPLYSFGHGLSYTTFQFGKASVNKPKMSRSEALSVNIPIKNTGQVAGMEVVQLYIHDSKASVLRPEKELKDFEKVYLLPGEEKLVTLTIDAGKLSFYDDKKGQFVAEPGQFVALVGSSSQNIYSKINFELE